MASIRRRRNSIETLLLNGKTISEPFEIKKAAVDHFKLMFEEEYLSRPTFSGLNFKTLTQAYKFMLTEKFTIEEIDAAVASCDGCRSRAPDGWEVLRK